MVLCIAIWAHLLVWYRTEINSHYTILWGIFAGLSSVGSIFLAAKLQPGIFVDLRYAPLALSGLFGGPVSALIAISCGIAYRAYLGGPGAAEGILAIAAVATVGAIFHAFIRGRLTTTYCLLVLAIGVGVVLTLLLTVMPTARHAALLANVGLPVILMNSLAIMLSGLILQKTGRSEMERRVLEAAYAQSPDYVYVKDLDSAYVSVNNNVATYYHMGTPQRMVGATDFSLRSRPDAEAAYHLEQQIIKTGIPLLDALEEEGGRKFLTSRVPIRDETGEILGLACVSRDITERVRLEQQLRENRNLLSAAMNGMSEGFAMFDQKGFLVYCNENYRSAFPLSRDARKVGAHITDILRASARIKERVDHPAEATDAWVTMAAATLHQNKDEIIQLSSGEWLALKTRLSNDGTAMVIVSDITAEKAAEAELQRRADQLRDLAEKDGLTGLSNRRTFDVALQSAISTHHSTGERLSVLMIDIDRFKAYNDTYGHIAGDVCLKSVSEVLQASATVQGSCVARYGGEEFAILLSGADGNAAKSVAVAVLKGLAAKSLPHKASEFGRITASIGIASLPSDGGKIIDLVAAADAALYLAKSQGRNRFVTHSPLLPLQVKISNVLHLTSHSEGNG